MSTSELGLDCAKISQESSSFTKLFEESFSGEKAFLEILLVNYSD